MDDTSSSHRGSRDDTSCHSASHPDPFVNLLPSPTFPTKTGREDHPFHIPPVLVVLCGYVVFLGVSSFRACFKASISPCKACCSSSACRRSCRNCACTEPAVTVRSWPSTEPAVRWPSSRSDQLFPLGASETRCVFVSPSARLLGVPVQVQGKTFALLPAVLDLGEEKKHHVCLCPVLEGPASTSNG